MNRSQDIVQCLKLRMAWYQKAVEPMQSKRRNRMPQRRLTGWNLPRMKFLRWLRRWKIWNETYKSL